MKTIAFVSEPASKRPDSTGSAASAASAVSAVSEASEASAASLCTDIQPACWRSEAFAEDLLDTQTALRNASPRNEQPLLRRALARLLRR